MSERTLKRILTALGGLAAIYIVVLIVGRGSGAAAPSGELADVIEQWNEQKPTGFVIASPGEEPLRIDVSGSHWTVNGHAADSGAIERLQNALRDAKVKEIVSTNPQNHARLGVTADSAIRFEIHGPDTTTLLIGKSSQYGLGAYVRLPDQDQTAEVSGDLRGAVARNLDWFRDKVVIRVDTSRVTRIAIARDTQRYSLHRVGNTWRIADANAMTADSAAPRADSMTVANVLAEFARFEGTAFSPDTAQFEGTDRRSAIAFDARGDTLAAIEFAGREYIWRARRINDALLYEAASYRIDRITPRREDVHRDEG